MQKALFESRNSATFSECRKYRYDLTREISEGPTLNFLCCNPSTADSRLNDPTVARLERRARMWNYGRLVVTNVFAWRSTDPIVLKDIEDPVGPDNDQFILRWASEAETVVCAWGVNGELGGRGARVRRILTGHGIELFALKVNAQGVPWHPLYLGYDVTLKPYCRAEEGSLV